MTTWTKAPEPFPKVLVLFDFDGTLTRRDTLFAFLFFAKGFLPALGVVLKCSPWLVLALLFPALRSTAKERLLAAAFKGWPQARLVDKGVAFCKKRLPGLLRPGGMAAIRQHRTNGHLCALVTASMDWWTAPFAAEQGLTLISTQGEVAGGVFSGKFAGPNCIGPEKVTRIRAVIDPERFERVIAYGDSNGDKAMLALAQEAHYKPFRT